MSVCVCVYVRVCVCVCVYLSPRLFTRLFMMYTSVMHILVYGILQIYLYIFILIRFIIIF